MYSFEPRAARRVLLLTPHPHHRRRRHRPEHKIKLPLIHMLLLFPTSIEIGLTFVKSVPSMASLCSTRSFLRGHPAAGGRPDTKAHRPRSARANAVVAVTRAHADEATSGDWATPVSGSRRSVVISGAVLAALTGAVAGPAQAIGFKKELKKRKIPIEEYTDIDGGLKIYDLVAGSGDALKKGDYAVVHYDCYFRGIDVVSSRSARLLGGNRTIAEPVELIAGGALPKVGSKSQDYGMDEQAGGLYAAAGAPKAPPALPIALVGMKVGGKRSVMVPPELAYGAKGELEIPPDATIEMQIEVLEKK